MSKEKDNFLGIKLLPKDPLLIAKPSFEVSNFELLQFQFLLKPIAAPQGPLTFPPQIFFSPLKPTLFPEEPTASPQKLNIFLKSEI